MKSVYRAALGDVAGDAPVGKQVELLKKWATPERMLLTLAEACLGLSLTAVQSYWKPLLRYEAPDDYSRSVEEELERHVAWESRVWDVDPIDVDAPCPVDKMTLTLISNVPRGRREPSDVGIGLSWT